MRNTLIALTLALVIVACSTTRNTEAPLIPAEAILPYDASDLALLMRAMATHADSVKAAVQSNSALPPKPDFSPLFSATPTEGMHIDPITYPTFGKDYLSKLDDLYKAPRKARPQAYNALVQSCANCHGTHCPGPLMRIKKMYVAVEE